MNRILSSELTKSLIRVKNKQLTPKQIRNNLWAIIEDIDHGNYLPMAESHIVRDTKCALELGAQAIINLENIKDYLDHCIDLWRKKRDIEQCDYAKYYIDAFQSIRSSLFGETLAENAKELPVDGSQIGLASAT